MLDGAMLVWFVLTVASVAFVVWDSLTNGVTSWVQRIAWILVTLYAGPVGAFFYLMACRRPFPGGHDAFTAPTWKQGLNSEMHCLAGDATGIIIAASIVPAFALANGWDVLIEYSAGFLVGLFIFQALMMRGMYGGNYVLAVRKTIFAETVSMNLVMTGMIPTMILLADLWPGSDDPTNPEFWFRMSLATLVGGLFAFPINYWLVANHLKHGCMTLPGADGPAPHLGHRSPETAMGDHGYHPGGTAMAAGMAMTDGGMHSPHGAGGEGTAKAVHEEGTGNGGHGMQMATLPAWQAFSWITATFALLIAAIYLTSLRVPLSFAV